MSGHKAKPTVQDTRVPCLSDVESLVRTSADPVVARRRGQLLTSLRRLSKHAAVNPDVVPFVPPVLRNLSTQLTPATTGLSKKSLQNDQSNLRFLLGHLNLGGLTQYRLPLSGEHEQLMLRLTDRHERAGLSRFLRYACCNRIAVAQVDDTVSEAFRRALAEEGLIKQPEQTWRMAIRTWNKIASRWPELGLQSLEYPSNRRGWALRWSEFPGTLVSDVERYFERHSVEGDIFDPQAPDVILKPRTIETQRDWLRVLASAAVRSGIPVEDLASIERLVQPETVAQALRWLVSQRNTPVTEYIKMLAVQAQTVARRVCALTDPELAELSALVGRLHRRTSKPGDASTRLERLRQFEDPANLSRMLALSDHVVRTVRSRRKTIRRDPLDVALALAHELLLVTCMRCGNIAALDLDRHFIWAGKDRCLIRIPGDEVKNGDPLHKELPPHVVTLLRMYLNDYRPTFPESETSPWLFPGRKGQHKLRSSLSDQYRKFLQEWVGIDANPHLIRSFAHMLYTEHHPEGGEVMRRQLGHRSDAVRLKHYADPRSRAANRAYLELLVEERDKAIETIGLFR